MAATDTIRPPSRTFRWVASSHRYGHAPESGRVRKAFTRSSMSLHSLDTLDFDMPDSLIACARSSTRRVETPAIHASRITATSAFSTVFLGSRKPGTYESGRSFGIFR